MAQGQVAPELGTKYSDLIAFAAEAAGFRLEGQQARNRLSALNKYLEHLGLDAESDVGNELGAERDETLVNFVRAKERVGRSAGTLNNLRSYINQWANMWEAYVALKATAAFDGIGAAITHYLEKAKASGRKATLSEAAIQHGLGSGSYYCLLDQKTVLPTSAYSKTLTKLEEYLEAPPTALTRFVAITSDGLWEKARASKGTVYGQNLAELQKAQYRPKVLPKRLLKELCDFIKFKTATSPLLERNEMWRTKPKEDFAGRPADLKVICVDGKTFSATANIFLAQVRSFFGAKIAQGEDPETFSLVHMCDPQQLIDYLEFFKGRKGEITKGALVVLQNATSLLYSKGGWIYQQPAFGALLPTPVGTDEATWHAWCDAARNNIIKRIKNLNKDRLVKTGRDTQEAIKDILDRQHPLTALFEMVDGMEKHLVKYESQPAVLTGLQKAVLKRDVLIVKILTAQPLRVNMLRLMTYRADNTGNLYKRKAGEWCIRFKPEDFKNETGAAKDKAYDVPLPEDVYGDIERYLKHVRRSPAFASDTSDDVFVPMQIASTNKEQKTHWINLMLLTRSM